MVAAMAWPAAAQQRDALDVRGDAAPSADILRVHVKNGAQQIVVASKVANLARGSDITLVVNHSGPGRYILRTGGIGKGHLNFARGTDETRIRCRGWTVARHTGRLSRMVVKVPQRCFGKRAGTASFDMTMFQSRGMDLDTVAAMPFTLRRG
jgi:hypothetical protein